jgi:RNA polymerase sigma-70 factor (ECF subfamily)
LENSTTAAALAGLLAMARQGDSAAFERFIVLTSPTALRRLRESVPDEAVERLLVALYVQLWTSLDRFDPARTAPLEWLEANLQEVIKRAGPPAD